MWGVTCCKCSDGTSPWVSSASQCVGSSVMVVWRSGVGMLRRTSSVGASDFARKLRRGLHPGASRVVFSSLALLLSALFVDDVGVHGEVGVVCRWPR